MIISARQTQLSRSNVWWPSFQKYEYKNMNKNQLNLSVCQPLVRLSSICVCSRWYTSVIEKYHETYSWTLTKIVTWVDFQLQINQDTRIEETVFGLLSEVISVTHIYFMPFFVWTLNKGFLSHPDIFDFENVSSNRVYQYHGGYISKMKIEIS
jgi:hypothetical protein